MLVGAIATVALYTVGWTLFGLAALRGRAFTRGAVLLLLVGGLAGLLALSTPYQIPLAIAIGWIGYALERESRSRRTAATHHHQSCRPPLADPTSSSSPTHLELQRRHHADTRSSATPWSPTHQWTF